MPKIKQQIQVSGQLQTHMTHLRVFLEDCHVNTNSCNILLASLIMYSRYKIIHAPPHNSREFVNNMHFIKAK